jgi:hypothetical protein
MRHLKRRGFEPRLARMCFHNRIDETEIGIFDKAIFYKVHKVEQQNVKINLVKIKM